jgi:hypothetical protein
MKDNNKKVGNSYQHGAIILERNDLLNGVMSKKNQVERYKLMESNKKALSLNSNENGLKYLRQEDKSRAVTDLKDPI